jgi:diguanylate cyclase (GGDEF)-like protein
MAQEIIELRLGKDRAETAAVKSLLDRLLALISDRPVAGENKKLVELRSRIEAHRLKISAAREWYQVEECAITCFTVCQEYFDCARTHCREREEAIGEVIEVLREAVRKIAREAGDFHSKVLRSSDRLVEITEITDLREIKRQITGEVEGLKTLVAEKKKQEEESFSRLVRRAETLSIQLEQAREEASRDPLTRIANRGGFDRACDHWIATHYKRGNTFSLALLDVDDFKIVNDTHGHPIGDRVLTTIAERLAATVRVNDFAGRYGGEEFVVMLEGTKTRAARQKLTEFLEAVARSRFEYQKNGQPCRLQFTLSCGLTEYYSDDTREDLVARADEALYEAKHNGKNRVEVRKASLLRALLKKN